MIQEHNLDPLKLGELLIQNTFAVSVRTNMALKMGPVYLRLSSEDERQAVYLFERVIICLSEDALKKKKVKIIQVLHVNKIKELTENVDIDPETQNQSFELRIHYRNAVDFFPLKFVNEEQFNLWRSRISKCLEIIENNIELQNRNSSDFEENPRRSWFGQNNKRGSGLNPNRNSASINSPPATPPSKRFLSLFERTIEVAAKIYSFPECQNLLFTDPNSRNSFDPTGSLWKCFRECRLLCLLFNNLKPKKPLVVPDFETVSTPNGAKKHIYYFITSLKEEVKIEDDQLFTITELFRDSTNDFQKVSLY